MMEPRARGRTGGAYSRILVGYDGSPGADDALALAQSLAASGQAKLVLVAVLDLDAWATPPDSYERAIAEANERLGASARELLDTTPFTLRCLGAASAPRALAEIAEAEDADVIVLGSTHRGRVGRVLPGSVGERLLHEAPCAVLVAPRDFARREHCGLGEIGVAPDGRRESREALGAAAALAADLDAKLRLIAVEPQIGPRDLLPGELPPTGEELGDDLDRAVEALDADVEAAVELVGRAPAAALAERGVEPDLLVIGSRRYGPVRRVLLGGVSAEVMRTLPARCWSFPAPRSLSSARGPGAAATRGPGTPEIGAPGGHGPTCQRVPTSGWPL